MRLSDSVENIVSAMVYGNTVVQATPHNCEHINQIFALILSSVQEFRDRIASDRSKHLIAKTSSLGWKFVSSLKLLEGKVGHISMEQLWSQEQAFLAHELAVSSLAKSGSGAAADASGGGSGGGRGGGSKGGKGGFKNSNKNNNKNKGKKGLNTTKGGGVGKPKNGGCHGCGGGHL
jgi:hypothetical protein